MSDFLKIIIIDIKNNNLYFKFQGTPMLRKINWNLQCNKAPESSFCCQEVNFFSFSFNFIQPCNIKDKSQFKNCNTVRKTCSTSKPTLIYKILNDLDICKSLKRYHLPHLSSGYENPLYNYYFFLTLDATIRVLL